MYSHAEVGSSLDNTHQAALSDIRIPSIPNAIAGVKDDTGQPR